MAGPDCPFSVDTRSGRVLCSAGKSPKRRPVPMVSAAANRTTGVLELEGEDLRRLRRQQRHDQPQRPVRDEDAGDAAEHREQQRLGQELADEVPRGSRRSTSRTAISPARAAERASSRLAMFAQAISRTKPVTPSSMQSGVLASSARGALARDRPASTSISLLRNRSWSLAHALLQRRFDVVDDGVVVAVQRCARRSR